MTPLEKAKEIVSKIFEEQHVDDRAKMICLSTPKIAEMCVDEIINDLGSYRMKPYLTIEQVIDSQKYWKEVKQEIQKIYNK